MQKIDKSEEEWKKILSPERFMVLRKKGTERPFTCEYDEFFESGIYSCEGCGEELFRSEQKYNSGCGWPAFFDSISKDKIKEVVDRSHGMVRTEVMCAKCGGHLGHVFNDGPRDKTGLRYCINSLSLDFKKM